MNTNLKPNLLDVTVGDGKYHLVQTHAGNLSCTRYREPWRDCTGDQLILCLGQEIERLREHLQRIYEMEPQSPPQVEFLFESAVQIAKEALNPQP